MSDLSNRSTQEVFDDHLRLRGEGDPETDVARNYADDIIMLSETGIHRGRDGVRAAVAILNRSMPEGTWEYPIRLVEGEYAFLEWTGRARDGREVCDGADSFVVRDGRIVFQTMHYTVHGKST